MDLDFAKMPGGLVPAVVQDADTGQVLMLGYFDADALRRTEAEGRVTFFSRSKNRLWTKGETSGHYLDVVSLHADCDGDAVLVRARPNGPTCHRGTASCFEPAPPAEEPSASPAAETGAVSPAVPPLPVASVGFLAELERLVQRRRDRPDEEPNSYTARLFRQGLPRIARKVGEEAVETVVDALAGNREGLPGEAADLLYHLLVLLSASGSSLDEVLAVLRARHQTIRSGQRRE